MTERYINVIYINFSHRGNRINLIKTEIQLKDLRILPKLFTGVLQYNKNRKIINNNSLIDHIKHNISKYTIFTVYVMFK